MDIVPLLRAYCPCNEEQEAVRGKFFDFIRTNPDCLLRSCVPGHLTGSAFVVDSSGGKVLLVHHRKLGKWLQPGGHADGDSDLQRVAAREVSEETGLSGLRPLLNGVFDLDIHTIPARPGEPEHLHYDVRFLFDADAGMPLLVSHESHSLCWIKLQDVPSLSSEESILRMVRKASLPGRG